MSSLLYSLGRWAYRKRRTVLALWLAALVILAGGALAFSKGADNAFAIPGTESQDAIDSLSRTFPEVSGATAQFVIVAPDGETIEDPEVKRTIEDAVVAFAAGSVVASATSPFDPNISGAISDSKRAAIINIQLDKDQNSVTESDKDVLRSVADDISATLPSGAEVALGGQIFSTALPGLSIVDLLGLIVALVVLVLTFGSFLAAGMPLVTSILGVALSIALIFLATLLTSISSTTPVLALMLGLAVGIDYALFIISRHQQQLKAGVDPEESTARAAATAGSAVVFAGLTVIIALIGLSVANIPFLTTMGVAGAVSVAIAVFLSVTLIPALLGFAGNRLTPRLRPLKRTGSKRRSSSTVAKAARREVARQPEESSRFFLGWVRTATRRPIVTIVAIVVALGALALPALQLRLALPDAGALPANNQAGIAYDLVSDNFGEGFNGPLIVTGSIVNSTDPLGLMADLKADIEELDGVAAVPVATPNRSADTGILQVIPTGSPDSDETKQLVTQIRGLHDHFLDTYGVDLSVTGFTAIGIDISDLLGGALLPFGAVVVGLSLILLTMVFRSIWVPIKATVGYLLSLAAAFGVVALVFEHGVLAEALNVARTGPIISFMPIIVMGVLFGLAMDYEVFLVSRMREDFVRTGNATTSVSTGFLGSAKVVTAAAVIMFAVFAGFVPEGDNNIKPIALGLAVGVFIDAFLIRMTFVPAVMTLLGDRAWYMPKWLDRMLPSFDIEGEGLHRELELRAWPPDTRTIVAAEGLTLHGENGPLFTDIEVAVMEGDVLMVTATAPVKVSALLLTLAGRVKPDSGRLKIAGNIVPDRASAVRSQVGYVHITEGFSLDTLHAALKERPRILVVDGISILPAGGTRDDSFAMLRDARRQRGDGDSPLTVVVGTAEPSEAAAGLQLSTAVIVQLNSVGQQVLIGGPLTLVTPTTPTIVKATS